MLPKTHRLEGRLEKQLLFQRGKKAYSGVLGLRYLENRLPASRFSIVVGKRVFARAVDRNRAKRLVREVIRMVLSQLQPGYDGVFLYIKKPLKRLRIEDIERDTLFLLRRAGIL